MRRIQLCCALVAFVALSVVALAHSARAAVLTDVSATELLGFKRVYQYDIPTSASLNGGPVPYNIDNTGSISLPGGFDRIAYYMELQPTVGQRQWVWVSMDAFDTNLGRIGIPNVTSTQVRQITVGNMNVETYVTSPVSSGTNLQTGSIEFWPSNYAQGTTAYVPTGSGSAYDWNDSGFGASSGYGSMQVHNWDLDGAGPGTIGQTIFGYNRWGASGTSDLGIGNFTGGNPDWTFAGNAAAYSIRNLEVWVRDIDLYAELTKPVPEPSSALLAGGLVLGLIRYTRRRRSRS